VTADVDNELIQYIHWHVLRVARRRRTTSLELAARMICVIQLLTCSSGLENTAIHCILRNVSALVGFYVITLHKSTFTYLLTYRYDVIIGMNVIMISLCVRWYPIHRDSRRPVCNSNYALVNL